MSSRFQDLFSISLVSFALVPCRPCPGPAASAEELLLGRAVPAQCCPAALSSCAQSLAQVWRKEVQVSLSVPHLSSPWGTRADSS